MVRSILETCCSVGDVTTPDVDEQGLGLKSAKGMGFACSL